MSSTHPRLAPRRGSGNTTWWGKAWARSLEEATYGADELKRGRKLARDGAVGAIEVSSGRYVAAVQERHDVFTVTGTVEPFDETSSELFIEVVAGGAGRMAALLSGELPLTMVEACEEVGVELVPYAGELGWTCSCDAWVDPCPHGLAVAVQVGWLLGTDPLTLLHLRGLPREELLARVHAVAVGAQSRDQARHQTSDQASDQARDQSGGEPAEPVDEEDLESGLDAALRAQAALEGW